MVDSSLLEASTRASAKSPVPLIDFSRWRPGSLNERKKIAEEVDAACRRIGFLVIKGHSVPPEVVAGIDRATRAFFDLPLEAKRSYSSKKPEVFRGYTEVNSTALSRAYDDEDGAPDFREGFSINRISIDGDDEYYNTDFARSMFADNIWPDAIEDFKPAWESYYRALEELASEIMQSFALALGVEQDYFEPKIRKHMTGLLASNYPEPAAETAGSIIRAGAHTDYGTVTILHADDVPGGFQVQTDDGVWRDVPIVPGAFIVNIGDMMARWTNDRWVSTIHRVVGPPRDRVIGSRRQSFAFFHYPNCDAIVECLPTCEGTTGPKYAAISAGTYLLEKLQQIQTGKAYRAP
jgi:isopenicillin N synthase-like dioxygenase